MKNIIQLCLLALLLSCTDTNELPTTSPHIFSYPNYFPTLIDSEMNPATKQGVNLGRMLYFDAILSSNGRSCSTCHHRDKSFSTPLFELNGLTTSVPPHINLAWNPSYNWNGSEEVLDVLCIGDFGPDFFNTNMDSLRSRFNNHSSYPDLFQDAFNVCIADESNDAIQHYVSYAVSQFMRSIISSNSNYDKHLEGDYQLSAQEQAGLELFNSSKAACFRCHGGALFTDNRFHNNGLDSVHIGVSQGRFLISGNANDIGKFSTPTLRNIELTAPYMHDGRFETLENVILFYSSKVQNSVTLAAELSPHASGISLSKIEQAQLVSFLKTLTDYTLLENPNYENPHN